jgi:hypothetical protein
MFCFRKEFLFLDKIIKNLIEENDLSRLIFSSKIKRNSYENIREIL